MSGYATSDRLDRAYNDWIIDTPQGELVIALLTPKQFKALPDGTEMVAIDGARLVKGKVQDVDMETRGGLLAFGLRKQKNPEESS